MEMDNIAGVFMMHPPTPRTPTLPHPPPSSHRCPVLYTFILFEYMTRSSQLLLSLFQLRALPPPPTSFLPPRLLTPHPSAP